MYDTDLRCGLIGRPTDGAAGFNTLQRTLCRRQVVNRLAIVPALRDIDIIG